MKVLIAGKEIPLKDDEVVIARKAVNVFFDSIRSGAVKTNTPSIYLTAVIIAYVKTRDIIDSISPDNLQILLDLVHGSEEEREWPH